MLPSHLPEPVPPGLPRKPARKGRAGPRAALKPVLVAAASALAALAAAALAPPIAWESERGVYANFRPSRVFWCFDILNLTLYSVAGAKPGAVPVLVAVYGHGGVKHFKVAEVGYSGGVDFYPSPGGACFDATDFSDVPINTGVRLFANVSGAAFSPAPPSAVANLGNGSFVLAYHQPAYLTSFVLLTVILESPEATLLNNYTSAASCAVFGHYYGKGAPEVGVVVGPGASATVKLSGNFTSLGYDCVAPLGPLKIHVVAGRLSMRLLENWWLVALTAGLASLAASALRAGRRARAQSKTLK